jgi:hypothetical protein
VFQLESAFISEVSYYLNSSCPLSQDPKLVNVGVNGNQLSELAETVLTKDHLRRHLSLSLKKLSRITQ